MGVPTVRPESSADHNLFRELMDRFTILADTCARFSQEVYRRSGTPIESDVEGTVKRNLTIAKTVFAKWSLEILAVIYLNRRIGFPELQRALGDISVRVLTGKLRDLEKVGLVQREVSGGKTAGTRYYLTHKGLMITRLGEPVFLYLRLADGWRYPPEAEEARRHSADTPTPVPMGQL